MSLTTDTSLVVLDSMSATVRTTVVPFLPLILSIASSTLISSVVLPSTARIISPLSRPAFSAGESFKGDITVRNPSFTPTSAPIPDISPTRSSSNSFVSVGSKKSV